MPEAGGARSSIFIMHVEVTLKLPEAVKRRYARAATRLFRGGSLYFPRKGIQARRGSRVMVSMVNYARPNWAVFCPERAHNGWLQLRGPTHEARCARANSRLLQQVPPPQIRKRARKATNSSLLILYAPCRRSCPSHSPFDPGLLLSYPC